MSMGTRRDQHFREQPSLFDQPSPVVHSPAIDQEVDHGIASRDETYRDIVDNLPDRCRIWLARVIAAGENGVTLDELSAMTGTPAHEFSGRITELKERRFVRHTETRRPTRSGSTASVIQATARATEPQPIQQEISAMATKTIATDLPDAITNTVVPRDQDGDVIQHGARYLVPGVGRVQVHHDVDADEYMIFPVGRPDKQQTLASFPSQSQAWERMT
ncbi:MAG: hypothetical protein WBD31_01450 [Rubripirellula sp.]